MIGFVAVASAATKPFALVREGKPAATIVIAKDATVAATFAASELRDHVHKITGATLPIVADDAPVTGPQILVGESKATIALGLRNDTFQPREYLIRFLPDTLVLMGKDRTIAESRKDPRPPTHATGKFGGGLRFDGTNNLFAADTGFDDAAGTMETWVWLPKEPSDRHGDIFRMDGHSPSPWWSYHIVGCDPKSGRMFYMVYSSKGPVGKTLRSGELSEGWHHVAVTHSAADNRIELFIDGKSVGADVYPLTSCRVAPFNIGGNPPIRPDGPVGGAFGGVLDEIRVSKTIRKPTPESIAAPYKVDADTTFLMHADETAGDFYDADGKQVTFTLPSLAGERGTLNAVYDFLEKFCDVHWYAPGEIGVVCPQTSNLVAQGMDVRRAPAMQSWRLAGNVLSMPTCRDPVPANDADIWRLRMRLNHPAQPFSHSFDAYYDRFFKDHPDWFAQGYPGQPSQPCFTHPEFIQQVVQDARDYFDGKGNKPGGKGVGDFFGVCPNDTCEWCKCPRCQAELNKAEANNQQFSNGKASDYIFNFTAKVARGVRKTHPDKWIAQFAYSDYAYYPTTNVVLEPNMAVELCLHMRNWWCPTMAQNDLKVLNGWSQQEKGKRPLLVWLYYEFPAHNGGAFNAFPGFFAHTIPGQMKRYFEAGVSGMYIEHSSQGNGNYLMDQLELYVTYKLADDPTLDGNKLIDEFFARYYGAAAGPMKALYERIERTFMDPKSYPIETQTAPMGAHQTEALAWGSLGTAERMKEYAKLMDQAAAAARTPEEKQRVALFDKGIWQYMLAGRDTYAGKYAELSPVHAQKLPDTWKVAMDPAKQGITNRWFGVEFDDSVWKQASILECLEKQGYKDYQHAWYRTAAVVPKEWQGQKVILYLGAVDETCWVWLNGNPIGEFLYNPAVDADSWQNPLRFDITKAVQAGTTNQITVLVRNTVGAGGIWKPSYLIHRPADWNPPAWCKTITQP